MVHLLVLQILGRRRTVGDGICDVLQSTISLTLSSTIMHFDIHPQFLDKCRSITFNRFVINIVKSHHLQLRHHPPLFRNFKWCNIKVVTAHCAIVKKEVNELLVKGFIETLTGGAGFNHICLWFLNILVVYDVYLVLSDLIAMYTYLLLRFLLSDRYDNLFKM